MSSFATRRPSSGPKSNRSASNALEMEAESTKSITSSNSKDNVKVLTLNPQTPTSAYNAKLAVSCAKRMLLNSGAWEILSKHLHMRINSLNNKDESIPDRGPLRSIIVDGWIEELIRFFAVKTQNRDVTIPFQYLPSEPIHDAWRLLMLMPKTYEKLCLAMGNETVIDHDPYDVIIGNTKLDQMNLRFNVTLRAYRLCFGIEPPSLFWPKPSPKPKTLSEMVQIALPILKETAGLACGQCALYGGGAKDGFCGDKGF